jgi:hypothetical protein
MDEEKKKQLKEIANRTAAFGKSLVTPRRIKKGLTLLVLLALVGGAGKIGVMKVKAARRVSEDAARLEIFQKMAAQRNQTVLSSDEVKEKIAVLLDSDVDSLTLKRLSVAEPDFKKKDRDKRDEDDKHEKRDKEEKRDKKEKSFKRQDKDKASGLDRQGERERKNNRDNNNQRPQGMGPDASQHMQQGPMQQGPMQQGSMQQGSRPDGNPSVNEKEQGRMVPPAAPVPGQPAGKPAVMPNRAGVPFGRPVFYKAQVEKDGMRYNFLINAVTGEVVDSHVRSMNILERMFF